MWKEFGFRASPYWTWPITADDDGTRLLVGRESEVRQLLACLSSTSAHSTIEGPLGVGKTSLVGVAGYRALQDYRKGRSPKLFIPIPRPIRLTSRTAVSDVKRRLYLDLSQACIFWRDALSNAGYTPPASNYWVNHTSENSIGFALNAPLGAESLNPEHAGDASGFDEPGFVSAVQQWLKECFHSPTAGGFVCVIEDLETLATSGQASKLLEALRDDLFKINGLRCVLCSAKNMVRSVSLSPNLRGLFAEPMDLDPLPSHRVAEVIDRRVAERKVSDRAYVPVDGLGFKHLYDVISHNLRDSLKYSQDFAVWVHRLGKRPTDSEGKLALLKAWIAELADKYSLTARGLPNDAWEVFDEIVSRSGAIAPCEIAALDSKRPQIKVLEEAELLDGAIDETDHRRRTICVTTRGWMVQSRRDRPRGDDSTS